MYRALLYEMREFITPTGIGDVHYFLSISHVTCLYPLTPWTLAFFLRAASPLTSRTQLSHDLPSALHKEHLFTEHLQ